MQFVDDIIAFSRRIPFVGEFHIEKRTTSLRPDSQLSVVLFRREDSRPGFELWLGRFQVFFTPAFRVSTLGPDGWTEEELSRRPSFWRELGNLYLNIRRG